MSSVPEDTAFYSSSRYHAHLRGMKEIWGLLLEFMIFLFCMLAVIQTARTVNKVKLQTGPRDREGNVLVVEAPAGKRHSVLAKFFLRLTIAFHYIYFLAIYLVCFVFSLDCLSFLVSKKTLFLNQLGVLLSWIVALPADKTQWYLAVLVLSIIAAMCLVPLLLMFVGFILQVFRVIKMWAQATSAKNRVPSNMKEFLAKVCGENHVRSPEIFVSPREIPVIETHVGLPFGGPPILEVSASVLANFTDKEVMVMIAHEVGHVSRDLVKLRWATLLSRIVPFSCNYLVLAVDFVNMEYAADAFARSATGNDKDSLESAVIKLNLLRTLRVRPNPKSISLLQTLKLPDLRPLGPTFEFLIGNVMPGYVHPFPRHRLLILREVEKKKKEVTNK